MDPGRGSDTVLNPPVGRPQNQEPFVLPALSNPELPDEAVQGIGLSGQFSVNLRCAVTNHEHPVPVFQTFLYNQLFYATVIPVEVCIGAGITILFDPADDTLITTLFCLSIQQFFLFMIQIHAVFHI